jgi:putative ABC transport system permease protein
LHFYKIPENANLDTIYNKIINIPFIKENFSDAKIEFTPLKDLHFKKGTGNKTFFNTLILIAVLLLFTAFANYVNFAVANTRKLLKTAAIRQVNGETKTGIFASVTAETIVLYLLASVVAILICHIVLPYLYNITGYEIILSDNIGVLTLCISIFLVVGIIASLYPAKIMTQMQLATALKGIITAHINKWTIGKIFTVIQYAISIILVAGILFMQKQILYIKNFDLGFNKENILIISTTDAIKNQEKAFADELLKNKNITDYAYSQAVPGNVAMGWGRTIDNKNVNFKCWAVDEHYLKFMGFDIVKGRNFSDNINVDENNFIFNQTAIKEFGWQNSAIGKLIPGFNFKGKIIGIVKDVKYASLHEDIYPMAFWLTKTRHNKLSLKISGNNVKQTIDYIKNVYSDFEKKYPINYSFLDKQLDNLYKTEEKQSAMIFIFSIISIFISFIGTLGLIIFITEYRIKEIGIRKVNGASVSQILFLLNKSFIKRTLAAYVIAVPVAYWSVKIWLQNFAYQTNLAWWIFALAGIIIMFISIATVSIQSFFAARKNPVKALRYE